VDDLRITSLGALLDCCNAIRRYSSQLTKLVEEFNINLSKIDNLWQTEEGADKYSYLRNVNNSLNELLRVANSGLLFADSMQSYHDETKTTGNRSA